MSDEQKKTMFGYAAPQMPAPQEGAVPAPQPGQAQAPQGQLPPGVGATPAAQQAVGQAPQPGQAQPGQPQQGYAPQPGQPQPGQPQQGYAPQPGQQQQGYAPQPGQPQPGQPQQGYAPQPGQQQQGYAPQPGQPQPGQPQPGQPQPGQPQQGYAPQPGQPQQGYAPQPGQPQQGYAPQPGQPQQGYAPQPGAPSARTASKALYLGLHFGGLGLGIGLMMWGMSDRKVQELVLVAPLLLLVGFIAFYVLMYKAWASIQDGYTKTTPGKAVGFSFIPFFNIYWMFVAIGSWGREYNSYVQRTGKQSNFHASEGLFTTHCVLQLLVGGIAFLITMPMVISQMCNGINALAAGNLPRAELRQ